MLRNWRSMVDLDKTSEEEDEEVGPSDNEIIILTMVTSSAFKSQTRESTVYVSKQIACSLLLISAYYSMNDRQKRSGLDSLVAHIIYSFTDNKNNIFKRNNCPQHQFLNTTYMNPQL